MEQSYDLPYDSLCGSRLVITLKLVSFSFLDMAVLSSQERGNVGKNEKLLTDLLIMEEASRFILSRVLGLHSEWVCGTVLMFNQCEGDLLFIQRSVIYGVSANAWRRAAGLTLPDTFMIDDVLWILPANLWELCSAQVLTELIEPQSPVPACLF